MTNFFKFIISFLKAIFTKTKKTIEIPQGKEYENWLGV